MRPNFPALSINPVHDDAEFIRENVNLVRAGRILNLPSAQDVGGAVDYYQWQSLLTSVSGFEAFTPRRDGARRDAVVLFHYSLAYLALLFCAMVADVKL